ncbi:MAG: hypothetical protein VW600_16985 [Ferrovibrio sp.]
MSQSYTDLARKHLHDGASFLGATTISPAMTAGIAPLEDWIATIENAYHGLLCLVAAQANLHAIAPITAIDLQGISEDRGIGQHVRDLLGPWSIGHHCPLARMPVAERLQFLGLILLELQVVQGDLVAQQRDWVLDAVAMSDIDAAMQRLLAALRLAETGTRLRL